MLTARARIETPGIVASLASPTPMPLDRPDHRTGRCDQTPVGDEADVSEADRVRPSVEPLAQQVGAEGNGRRPPGTRCNCRSATLPSRYGTAGGPPTLALPPFSMITRVPWEASEQEALKGGGVERRVRRAGGGLHLEAGGDGRRSGLSLSHLQAVRLTARRHGSHQTAVDIGDLVVLEQPQHEVSGGYQRNQRQADQHDGKLVTKPHLWRSPGSPSVGVFDSIPRCENCLPQTGDALPSGVPPRPRRSCRRAGA